MCLETKTIKKEDDLLQCIQRCILSQDLLRTIFEGLFFMFFSILFNFCVEQMSKICKRVF